MLRGLEGRAVQRERLGRALPREVVREDVGQPACGRQACGVVGGAQQPHRRRRDGVRRRVEGVHPAGHLEAHPARAHHRDHVVDVRRELRDGLVADPAGAVPQGPGGDRVGSGGAADAEVDPARVGRLEQRELLGHDQRRVVGQHHPARAHPDARGGGGDHRDQDGRVRRGDGRHVVVLGQPVPLEAELVGHPCQSAGGGEGVAGGLVGAHGHEVEDGQQHACPNAREGRRLPCDTL